jgi:hypothetical protein
MDAMKLGREMMDASGDLQDDKQCCDWARIGQLLTQLGTPMMPKSINDLKAEDKEIVIDALTRIRARHRPV